MTYICPQCGPDPDGAELHAQNYHTWPPRDIQVPTPAHWPKPTDPPPTRACRVCIYGTRAVGSENLYCGCYQVSGGFNGLQSVEQARSNNGNCGPQARYLIVKGE